MNGNSGIVPTIDLATNNNNGYAYPIMPMMNGFGGYGNSSFLGGDGIWIIILLLLVFGNGNWGGNNGGFFGNGFNNEYAWLSNGQKEIMNNTNNGFDTLHLSNQIEGTRDAVHNISTQLCDGFHGVSNQICSSTADITSAINGGFANAEISNNARQIANMQQAFNSQISTLQGFNQIGTRLDDCCCENRLATCQTQNIIQNEANSTRFADANNTIDIITNATSNTQAILDKLCQLELDSKQDRINELERQVLMKDLQASQVSQTAQLRLSEEQQFDSFYNRLKNCPVNAVAVYGNTPVFSCPGNNGCGCNGYNNFI